MHKEKIILFSIKCRFLFGENQYRSKEMNKIISSGNSAIWKINMWCDN